MVKNGVVLSIVASMSLSGAHMNMNWPPTWHDHHGVWKYSAGICYAGCKGKNATRPAEGCVCEIYSNYTFIPGEPTIPPMSPLKTYTDACANHGPGSVDSCCQPFCQDPKNQMAGQPCEGCDWTRKMPWRAPGSAPVWSPCGFDGGNPIGCPPGNPDPLACNGGGYGYGPDSRLLPSNAEPTVWIAGGVEEVSMGVTANHGGGYQYRLCPRPANRMDLTEECFQRTPLELVGDTQWLQNGTDTSTRTEIPALRTVVGTTPVGSQWTRLAIPACGGFGGGFGPEQTNCTGLGTQFEPPIEGAEGFRTLPWNVIDHVHVPNLPTGDYVLGFRHDCEQTSQVWQQCGDIRIVNSPSVI